MLSVAVWLVSKVWGICNVCGVLFFWFCWDLVLLPKCFFFFVATFCTLFFLEDFVPFLYSFIMKVVFLHKK